MIQRKLSKLFALTLLVGHAVASGCGGNNQAVLPSGELTEEQKAAIKADDDRVNDEESQGSFGKKNKKK